MANNFAGKGLDDLLIRVRNATVLGIRLWDLRSPSAPVGSCKNLPFRLIPSTVSVLVVLFAAAPVRSSSVANNSYGPGESF